jgi:hypothetical protein
MLLTITQGESQQADRDLFATLGPLLTSLQLHKKLGMAITSQPGDRWLIEEEGGEAKAFAQARPLKSRKAAHIRYLHGDEDQQRQLLQIIIDWAAAEGLRELYTNERASNQALITAGFTIRPNNRTGAFVRWQLDMNGDNS